MEPLLKSYETDEDEWKEGNFLPLVCGTESSAVVLVLSFSSGIRDKSKVVDGKDTIAAQGRIQWSVMKGDWADAKDGGLKSEWMCADTFP